MKHMKRILPPIIAVFVAVSVAWAVASYPTSVKTFPTRVSGEVIQATWFNEPYDEITAIESGLLNGFAHALKPSTDAGQTLGTSALRWKQALLGLGTITVDTPALDITGTWNAVAVAFTGIKANFTDTASAAASLLLDLQVGGVSKFKVDKAGEADATGGIRIGSGQKIIKHLSATATWDPPNLAALGDTAITNVTVTGAVLGDPVTVSHTQLGVKDMQLTAWVSAAGNVRVLIENRQAANTDIASGTVRVDVWQH